MKTRILLWSLILAAFINQETSAQVVIGAPSDNNGSPNTAVAYSAVGTPVGVTASSTISGNTGTNLSLGKTATASSTENTTYLASKAIDGSATLNSRWSSLSSDNQWITVNLSSSYNVTQIRLNWEAAYGKSYKLQTSNTNNGTDWVDVYSTTTGSGGIETITTFSTVPQGQYIRMLGITRGTTFGYSLWEFEIYGGPALTYSLTTNPSSYFAINPSTGVVSLASASVPPGTYTIGIAATSTPTTSASSTHTITVSLATPTISGASSGCGPGSVALTASAVSPAGGTYNWYNTATGGTSLATGSTYSPSVSGTYYVSYTSGGVTSARSTGKAVTINANPFVAQTTTAGQSYSYPFTGNANDATGTNNGIVQGSAPLTTDRYGAANSAYSFNGSTQYISTATQIASPGPQEFTISLWFNSTAAAGAGGGKLIGFGSTQSGGNSANYDRHIYMTNSGQLVFGVYSGTTDTIRTGKTYNDKTWHLVTASFSAATGTKLYVDGVLASSDPTQTAVQSYAGYWRIGNDNINGWPDAPINWYFTGSLDDVRIFNRVLSDNEVYSLQGVGISPVCSGSTLNLFAKVNPGVTGATYSWTGPNSFTSALQNPTISNPTSADAGTYTVTVTSTSGCVSTESGTATIYALPSATITGGTTAAVSTATTFSSAAETGVTYVWTTGGGTAPSTTSSTIDITWATSGTKTVTLTATNATTGCVSTSSFTVLVLSGSINSYAFTQSISLNSQNAGTLAPVTNIPILVYIKEDALKVGTNCNNNVQFPSSGANGYDFAFTTSTGTTELPYEVDRFNSSTGELLAWVQIPVLNNTTTTGLKFYFGSLTPAHPAAFTELTWSSDYKAVYHFSEGSTSATVLDATSNSRDATQVNTDLGTDEIRYAIDPTGTLLSGGAYKFRGVNTLAGASSIIQNTGAAAGITGPFTLSAWVNVTSSASNLDMKVVTNQNNYGYGYKMSVKGTTTTNMMVETEIRSSTYPASKLQSVGTVSTATTTTPVWHYIQSIYDGTNFLNYVDGALQGTLAGFPAGDAGSNIYIGLDYRGTTTVPEHDFLGTMDEVRISSVSKSADFIKAEYYNQKNPGTYTNTNTAITATSAAAVSAIGGGITFTWKTTAASTDPTVAANWTSSSGSIPIAAVLAPPLDGTVTISIPNSTTGNYPKLTSPATISGLSLTGNNATLDLNGYTLNVGCNIYNISGGQITSANTASGLSWTGAVASQTYTGSATPNTARLGNMTINNSLGGTITMSGGPVDIYNSLNFTKGNLTIASSTTFTLKSDATATAYVSSIPTASTITGIFNVERYISGSPTSLARRGYRLMSSPVYAGNAPGYNVVDLSFLKNSSIVTGFNGATNGFTTGTSTTANASIYLFREDIVPNNTTFAAGNFKGITKLNPGTPYLYGINNKTTLTNTDDAATYLPVGNGFLFFFRGNNTLNNTTTAGTKTTSPYNYPENTTFTQTGTLNRGTIIVKPWASSSTSLLYTTGINNNIVPNNIRGFNLVGNPYAATINWEKFNRNGLNSSIYGGDAANTTPISTTIWQYNSTSKQYASYQRKSTTSLADSTSTINTSSTYSSDGVVSNMISSGQGFFVIANASGQTLTFRESAKTTTQAAAANVVTLMSTSLPQSDYQLEPAMRIKLIKDDVNTDAFIVILNTKNDTKYSESEDALDLGGNGAQVSLSAYSSDDIPLSINRLPLPKLQPQVIPVLVDAVTGGLFSLKIEDLHDLPPIYQVWLMDNYKKDSLDLRAHNTYNFNIDKGVPETFGKTRFKLIIRQNPELGLRLLNFAGTKITNGNKLTWTVENEASYTNFTVERSTDGGKTFEVIGGFLSSGKGTYDLIDKLPVKGANQYRLKQDDINGAISYSKPVTIMYANTNSVVADGAFTVFPNPVRDVVNLNIFKSDQTQAVTYKIKITNGSGIVVKTATSTSPSWQNNVGNLYPGTYFIQVTNNATKAVIGTGKFVKL